MRVGVSLLPELPWAHDRRRWQRVEQLGFHHAWTFDHLAWRTLADSPWYATVPTLVAAALSTTTLRIGTWVTTPNFRHPVPLSKELMTLDSMSQGRLTIGLGAGAAGWDASILGQPELTLGQRSARFEEFVDLLDQLLTRRRTTWTGKWFSAVDARTIPGPVQLPRPPFVIAANGPRGMRLAATRAQGWATTGSAERGADPVTWWAGVTATAARFDEICAEAGRETAPIARYLNLEALHAAMTSVEQFLEYSGRAAELGFIDVVIPWPRTTEPFTGTEELLGEIAAELAP